MERKSGKKKSTGDLLSSGGTHAEGHAEGVITDITPELFYVRDVSGIMDVCRTSPYTHVHGPPQIQELLLRPIKGELP